MIVENKLNSTTGTMSQRISLSSSDVSLGSEGSNNSTTMKENSRLTGKKTISSQDGTRSSSPSRSNKKKEKKSKKKNRSDSQKNTESGDSNAIDEHEYDSSSPGSSKPTSSPTSTTSSVSLEIDITVKNIGPTSNHSEDSVDSSGRKSKLKKKKKKPSKDPTTDDSNGKVSRSSSEEDMYASAASTLYSPTSAPRPGIGQKGPSTRDRRGLSFESLHGKSIHKSPRTRGGANPPCMTLSDTGAPKKKSVLRAKREKQLLEKQKQLQVEKQEEFIRKGLDIVANSSSSVNSNDSNSDDCSIVTDGSYETDDLFDEASLVSQQAKVVTGHESSTTNTTFDSSFVLPTDDNFTGTGSTISSSMASSMSPFPEELEADDGSIESSSLQAPQEDAPPLREFRQHRGPRVPTRRQPPMRSKSDASALRVKLPGQSRSVTRQRSLQFNEKVRVKRVPCQAQLVETEEELADLWFQPEEYDAIKRKTMALIRAVQDDKTGGVTYCTRGLERYFSVEEVQEMRNNAWDTVMGEQDSQRGSQTFDDDKLGEIYSKCTRQSSQEAVERAKLDETSIARYTKKTRQRITRAYSMPIALRPNAGL